jgi:hypothetical protein
MQAHQLIIRTQLIIRRSRVMVVRTEASIKESRAVGQSTLTVLRSEGAVAAQVTRVCGAFSVARFTGR